MGRNRLSKVAAALVIGGGALLANAGISQAIVNGSPTTASAHPWQVSLEDSNGQMCGGSIVSETVVVTAAHCTEGLSAGELSVRVGITNLADTGGQTVAVARVTNHPDYARLEVGDIAKLELAEPLRFGPSVRAIGLASAAELAAAQTGVVSGWGATSENGDGVSRLLATSVPLVADAACDRALGGIDAERETCAGGTGTDSCYGDSGGPLVIRVNGVAKLAGVVSWGEECGGNTPGVYAEVPTYAEWIGTGATTGTPTTTPATTDPVVVDPTTTDQEDTYDDADYSDGDDYDDSDYDYDDSDYDYDDADYDYYDESDYDDDGDCFWVEYDEYDAQAGEWIIVEELECDDDYYDYDYSDYGDAGYSYSDDDYNAWSWWD